MEEEKKLCGCLKNEATELHYCPYKAELNDDYETECDCCESCEGDCAGDI